MKRLFYIFLILVLFSCKKKEENPLLGNWLIEEKLNDEYNDYENFGLNIINDSILEYKFGFYEDVKTKMTTINSFRDTLKMNINALKFLGTKTKYKLKDSTLSFWDLSDSIWKNYKIKNLNHDTLNLIATNKKEYSLIKGKNTHIAFTQYDAIIVDRDYIGLGLTGINSTYINREGKIYFKGLGFNTNEDDFEAELDLKIVDPLFEKFDHIKIKDNYKCSTPDSQNNTVTFVKNGKIVKSIQDCGRKASMDFFAAYNELSYLYQTVKNKSNYNFIFDNRLHFPRFENNKAQHKIFNSEFFLLELELQKGKEVNMSFNSKYNLNFSYGNQGFLFNKIETDGRYYTFYYNDNTTKTIDIGYNFIEANPIIKTERN